MAVRRTKDPAGLLPDLVTVIDEGSPGDFDALVEILEAGTPEARVERLRVHPQLVASADKLAAKLEKTGGNASDRVLAEIAAAEHSALYLVAAPQAKRDKARQDGTKKPREPVAGLQAWIDAQVKRATGETAGQLWERAPEWLTDAIGFDRFRKRVTAARKTAGMGRE